MKGWTKPKDRVFFELKGPDSVRYLNGQVTNDVSTDLSNKVIGACLCDLKGKVQAFVWVTANSTGDGLLIETEKSAEEEAFNRIDRYLIADDCELTQLESDRDFLHVIGLSDPPATAKECWRFGVQGYDVDANFDISNLAELDSASILIQQIRSGIPEYGFEINADKFPSELGLDKWAVDFHKGCYQGQEIISRIESVGKTKHELHLFTTVDSFSKDDSITNDTGKEIGKVVRDTLSTPDGLLTQVYGRTNFEKNGFEKIALSLPPKL